MRKILCVFLFIFLTFFNAYAYAKSIHENIASNVIRLHIIANSDSKYDQDLKLKVRDSVLEYMQNNNFTNRVEAYNSTKLSLDSIKKVAQQTLIKNDCFDDVTISLGDSYFPTKHYGNLSFPAGVYSALKITIGNGEGHNWWCVMYPTLCFSNEVCEDSEAIKNLESTLTTDSFEVISGKCNFKFKIVDWLCTF